MRKIRHPLFNERTFGAPTSGRAPFRKGGRPLLFFCLLLCFARAGLLCAFRVFMAPTVGGKKVSSPTVLTLKKVAWLPPAVMAEILYMPLEPATVTAMLTRLDPNQL